MTIFCIGMRVRASNPDSTWCVHYHGAEVVITGEHWLDGKPYWVLSGVSLRGREVGVYKHEAGKYLDPILPEGLESLEEINALYEPQGETA